MSIDQPEKPRRWYNDGDIFLHGFVRSNYVTAFTDWFMSFAGKAVELVLYATVLYSCAQLYPGVHLPESLSLAVFLVQMGALDIGGLALGKLARQAREDGNEQGAKYARRLSIGLISIMLIGVATVGIERVIPLPDQVQIGVQLALVIARSVGSVLYGRVVHDLKQETARTMVPVADVATSIVETEKRLTELFTQYLEQLEKHAGETERKVAAQVRQFQQETGQNVETISQQFHHEFDTISGQLSQLLSQINSMQKQEEISRETKGDLDEEVTEGGESESASEDEGTKTPGRKYYVTFEEASAMTGLTILQLNRRIKAGEIEVNSAGKVRVKSLEKLTKVSTKKPSPKPKDTQPLQPLQFVKKA